MEHAFLFLLLATCFGGFMAWGIGANDMANAMATSVGSGVLTLKQAIIIAIIFEAAGAMLAGGEVTQTIRDKIIDTQMLTQTPEILIYGMLSALLAAGIWLLVASVFGWPVSTTHTIIGAIIGFALIHLGNDSIQWSVVTNIVLSWVLTPFIAGTIAFLIFISIRKFIFNHQDPLLRAKQLLPFYLFLMSITVTSVTVFKGLRHLDFQATTATKILMVLAFSLIIVGIGICLLRRIENSGYFARSGQFDGVEKIFGAMMIFTASTMAFAHGSNDVANAIGPMAAVISIVQSGGIVLSESTVPWWILLIGAGGLVLGIATFGFRVIATVGQKITSITPTRGFSAEIAAAATVVISSGLGLPISTTHTLVGAVLGVGMARGIAALNLNVVRNIFMSWVVTLPAGGLLAALFFELFKLIL